MMRFINSVVKSAIRLISGYQIIRISDSHFMLGKVKANIKNLSIKLDRIRYSLDIMELINLYKINVVLDVGANVGQFAMMLRELGYKNRIVSFEPVRKTFEVLQKNSNKDNNWDVFNIALGSTNEEKTIHNTNSSDFSSFLVGNNQGTQIFGERIDVEKDEIAVIRRLDDVLPNLIQNLDSARALIKLDTQGYDLKVFAGLGDFVNLFQVLQSEVSIIAIYEGMPHITTSISEYEKAGFEIAGFYTVTRQKSTLGSIELDLVMVKHGQNS